MNCLKKQLCTRIHSVDKRDTLMWQRGGGGGYKADGQLGSAV